VALPETADIGEQKGAPWEDAIRIPRGAFRAMIATKRHGIAPHDRRFRLAMLHIKPIDTPSSHVRFRCSLRVPMQ